MINDIIYKIEKLIFIKGFVTSQDYNIFASKQVGLPAPECLMVKELVLNSLDKMHGYINYDMYETLK